MHRVIDLDSPQFVVSPANFLVFFLCHIVFNYSEVQLIRLRAGITISSVDCK